MHPTDRAAVWTGKLVLAGLQRLGRRGNALPGLVVEKAFPRFLPRAMAALPQGVVVVTGTNGKTTTTKMVAAVLARRYRVLTNDSGSNFVRGAITTAVERARWSGRLDADVAVLELDEAWAVRFVALVPPRRVLLLNVMRDQLDRFGEIDTTAALLTRVAAAATEGVVLNRDDPRIAAVAGRVGAPVTWFGVGPAVRAAFPTDEELYDDDVVPAGGGPAATAPGDPPGGGAGDPVGVPRAELRRLPDPDDGRTTVRLDGADHALLLRAEGAHNAQNAAAAAALALSLGLTAADVVAGLEAVEPAFGRGQAFDVDGRRVVLHLVKNPGGFRQSLRTLERAGAATVVVAINDADADGRDVSWLWDVDFAGVRGTGARVVTTGTRAADMALRLAYDEVATDTVDPEPVGAVLAAARAAAPGATVAVFATYTAMWTLHPRLERAAA